MIDGLSIEGFAVVSRDGMLAGADGLMPNSLKFKPDQDLLNNALDAAALLVHGKKSHEAQSHSHRRKRLLLTRAGGAFSTTPIEPNTWLWSPAATPFPDVCKALGISSGVVAILGGTSAYDMFLPYYARFHLCQAGKVELPGGVPVLGAVNKGRTPQEVLTSAGLRRTDKVDLDAACELRHETWAR